MLYTQNTKFNLSKYFIIYQKYHLSKINIKHFQVYSIVEIELAKYLKKLNYKMLKNDVAFVLGVVHHMT